MHSRRPPWAGTRWTSGTRVTHEIEPHQDLPRQSLENDNHSNTSQPATARARLSPCSCDAGGQALTDFGSVTFVGARVNYMHLAKSPSHRYRMVDSSGDVRATASRLTTGREFGVTWVHA